jgi:hypothetical protein
MIIKPVSIRAITPNTIFPIIINAFFMELFMNKIMILNIKKDRKK